MKKRNIPGYGELHTLNDYIVYWSLTAVTMLFMACVYYPWMVMVHLVNRVKK